MITHAIYFIVDESGSPFYVGQTKNLKKRKHDHAKCAAKGLKTHLYKKLAKMIRLGSEFDFEVVETGLSEEEANQREKWHIANLKSNGTKLCNGTEGGTGGDTNSGRKLTPQQCEQIRQRRIGTKHSARTRKKLSEVWTRTPEQLAAVGKILSEKNRGVINIKTYVLVDPCGVEHETTNGLCEFCRQHGLTHTNMIKTINGDRKHHKGWTGRRI